MPELRLERALRELGAELAIPAEPPLAASVARRLREQPARRLARPLWRRPAVVALAVLAAVVAATLAVEPARTALFELLRIGGVSVERVDRLPEVRRDAPLGLGRRVSLDEARGAVGFPVLVPSDDAPDGVFLSRGIPGGAVSLLYGDEDEPRLLVTQFRGSLQPDFVKKSASGTSFSSVLVRGVEGYWLSGAPHAVVFRDENGDIREDRNRLAGNVLLWVEDDVTFRLEGRMALPDALEIADSLR
jgi:hypothetical protein